jgi:pimeloyl-ACP methyl ester carboxylesterase
VHNIDSSTDITTSPARTGYATNGDCSLYYETFGSPGDPTVLLVNGLGSQCINYAVEWCAMMVAEGLQVVRFDNRDVGLSTHFTDAPAGANAYELTDMAADAIAVLDALGVERAHVMGLSMGGMIVQQLAIHHRDRILSMISVMSRTGEPEFGQSSDEAYALLTSPQAAGRDAAVERGIAGQRVWGSPDHRDEERARELAARAYDRCSDPAGVGRQFLAVGAAGSWADELPGVTTPTLVMHGTADTLIDISGGRRTAELIPGARFVAIEGMGHDYPPELWRRLTDEVTDFIGGL